MEIVTREGIMMCYIDDKIQMYHPIIARFTADYEEQVIIPDIKSEVQCPIYIVPNCEQENFSNLRPLQTHRDFNSQIK